MYKGKEKFTKDQLVFIVEAAIVAALDRIESALPSAGLKPKERKEMMNLIKPTELGAWDRAALETCGMNLGVLYAQLTDDGLGVGDAIDFIPNGCKHSIRSLAESFVKKSIKRYPKIPKVGERITPNVHPLAKDWVKDMFEDYLAPKNRDARRVVIQKKPIKKRVIA